MALLLPLQLAGNFCRYCCSSRACTSSAVEEQVAEILVDRASIFDVIKWQRVSKRFRKAALRRLNSYSRIDVQLCDGLQKVREDKRNEDNLRLDWHPTLTLVAVELGPNHLGIAVDSLLKWKDVRALFHLLIALSGSVEHLCVDSPVIEMLVAEVNKRQVKLLVSLLSQSRTTAKDQCCFNEYTIAPVNHLYLPDGPFFPLLKQLTITSQTSQLQHLSRLLSYSVSVKLIYHVEEIDLLCLKISIGNSWSRSKHSCLFKHLTRFRQWAEADMLGVRYFQQFDTSFTARNHLH
uniref:F-box domain-containing protein n=1 Tax=Syphacia muris TaxID=451379 RepID=A0A158R5Q6_9BILA